jgi:hypothetical protein
MFLAGCPKIPALQAKKNAFPQERGADAFVKK